MKTSSPDNSDASPNTNLTGILFVLAGVFVLTIMDVIAKILVEASYSPFQILAIRGWIITLSFMCWKALRGELNELKTARPTHHATRAAIGFLAPFCFLRPLAQCPWRIRWSLRLLHLF